MRCNVLKENIWRCKLLPSDVKHLKIKNLFWEDVLKSWNEYNYYHNQEIENQIIWYNSSLRINQKPIMWNDVYKKGLLYVHQLFENGEFKTHEQVWNQYGLTRLRYNSLKVAMPNEWKRFLQDKKEINFPLPPTN